jgi:hypothetical protein
MPTILDKSELMHNRRIHRGLVGGIALAALCFASTARADLTLGSLGGYAMFAGGTTSDNNSNAYINLNNYSTYGTLAAAKIQGAASNDYYGNVMVAASNSQPAGTLHSGFTFSNGNTFNTQRSDAIALGNGLQGLAATQTLSGITTAGSTIAGNGGVNVIDVNGNITKAFGLSGGANDYFVFNVTGSLNVGSGAIADITGTGVTANHIIFNFIGSGIVNTTVSDTLYGTLLSVNGNYTYNLDSVAYGAAINLYDGANAIKGSSDQVQYGKVGSTNYTFSGITAVPEPSSITLMGMGVMGLTGAAIRRHRRLARSVAGTANGLSA